MKRTRHWWSYWMGSVASLLVVASCSACGGDDAPAKVDPPELGNQTPAPEPDAGPHPAGLKGALPTDRSGAGSTPRDK